MNAILSELKVELESIISKLNTTIVNNEPFNTLHGNWTFPGITKSELIDKVQTTISLIDSVDGEFFEDHNNFFSDFKKRLEFLSSSTVPNLAGNPAAGIPPYLITIDCLRTELEKILNRNHAADLQKAVGKIRSLEARLKSVEPRMESLSVMVERIEHAYNTAEQLPADMELLNESRDKIKDIITKSAKDAEKTADNKSNSDIVLSDLGIMKTQAEDILKRCETAYAASTSVGLAAAFSERSNSLNKSMWFWIVSLIIALLIAAIVGSYNIHNLLIATQNSTSASSITARLFLSVLTIGGPVWFAWLATKQIGQRFRLAEDYAFKASVSRAYEGFRNEASRIDKNLEAKLLASALSRFDELPLRLVESETHGSPYHELLSSDTFKEALKVVPGLSERIKILAEQALSAANNVGKSATKIANKTNSQEKNDSLVS